MPRSRGRPRISAMGMVSGLLPWWMLMPLAAVSILFGLFGIAVGIVEFVIGLRLRARPV